MRALVLKDGKLEIDPRHERPQAAQGAILVRVIQAGICETDMQLVAGYMGFQGVLGHEFVGFAESGKYAGQRVVGEINCACQNCDYCRVGLGTHCPHRTVLGILNHDGAFAEYLALPEANLHLVPDSISDDHATLVEPIAAALQIPEQVELVADSASYVVGDGRLGNLCAQVLRQHGCRVTVIGKHDDKLATFAEMGFETKRLDEVPHLSQADVVVDCTGSESGLATSIGLAKPRGTVVMKTTVAGSHQLSLAPIVINELSLIGSRCGPFDQAIGALQQGQFQLENFITARYPLEDYSIAFERANSKNALKVILDVANRNQSPH